MQAGNQPEEKPMQSCNVCEVEMDEEDGYICPLCKEPVCPRHFDKDKNLCEHCRYDEILKRRVANK